MDKSREALRNELSGGPPKPPAAPVEKAPIKQEAAGAIVALAHSDRCPSLRGKECACAANLKWLVAEKVKPIEVLKQEWVEQLSVPAHLENGEHVPASFKSVPHSIELWRVDNGRIIERTIPHPSGSQRAPPFPIKEKEPPRWICTTCGWAGRGSSVSHRCDKTAVALATRKVSIAETLTGPERLSGRYRLTFWKDQDQNYHLGEELIEVFDGQEQVVKHVELAKDDSWDVIQGHLLNEVVDKLTP